jgi:hypothetical protein
MNLETVQMNLVHAIKGAPINAATAAIIRPGGSIADAESSLDIYRLAYLARMTEAIEESFAVTARSLDWQIFQQLCENYINSYPPSSYNLAHYGDEFPSFLRNITWLPIPISEIARFDRCYFELFHTEDPRPIPPEDFELLSENPRGSLKFASGFRLFFSNFAVHSYWSDMTRGIEADFSAVQAKEEFLAVYRFDKGIYVRPLTASQYHICDCLIKGDSIEKALEVDFADGEVAEASVSDLFKFLVNSGVVEVIVP